MDAMNGKEFTGGGKNVLKKKGGRKVWHPVAKNTRLTKGTGGRCRGSRNRTCFDKKRLGDVKKNGTETKGVTVSGVGVGFHTSDK